MGLTRLMRKARLNRTVAKKRLQAIKKNNRKPTIKNVDIEAIKAEFANNIAKEADK